MEVFSFCFLFAVVLEMMWLSQTLVTSLGWSSWSRASSSVLVALNSDATSSSRIIIEGFPRSPVLRSVHAHVLNEK